MKRRGKSKEKHQEPSGEGKTSTEKDQKKDEEESEIRPSSVFSYRRIAARLIIIAGVVISLSLYERYNPSSDTVLAKSTEHVKGKLYPVPCSKSFLEEKRLYPDCFPKKCGRAITDDLITFNEAFTLLQLAQEGIALGGSDGGASILDLHSGALSKKDRFINVYSILDTEKTKWFKESTFTVYKNVKDRIQEAIAAQFGISKSSLYLTHPTFFSQMTTKEAKTTHDEYWHVHVDKETYGSFHYTSLLYLNTYNKDFTGGRFTFVDKHKNTTVEPKQGRLSFFTSGAENPHFVEKLESGVRYAITISFTCDKSKAISNPVLAEKLEEAKKPRKPET